MVPDPGLFSSENPGEIQKLVAVRPKGVNLQRLADLFDKDKVSFFRLMVKVFPQLLEEIRIDRAHYSDKRSGRLVRSALTDRLFHQQERAEAAVYQMKKMRGELPPPPPKPPRIPKPKLPPRKLTLAERLVKRREKLQKRLTKKYAIPVVSTMAVVSEQSFLCPTEISMVESLA